MKDRQTYRRITDTRKCHNCKGVGFVEGGQIRAKCYYCKGTGIRNVYYGQNK